MVATTAPAPRAVAAPAPSTPPPSTARRLDEAVARAREGAAKLLTLSLDERVALARGMQVGYLAIARELVHAACGAKAIPLGTPLEGEEWTLGPWFVVRQLRLLQAVAARAQAHRQHPGRRGRPHHGRAAPSAGLPRQRHRRDALQRGQGGCPPGERHRRARADRVPRPVLQGEAARRAGRPGAGRRERQRDPHEGCAEQDLQRGQGLRPQDEPGERLPGSVPGARLRRGDPGGLLGGGLWWRGGGRLPGRSRRSG